MKSLFDIQTESGQLWPDISAQLEALSAAERQRAADELARTKEDAKAALAGSQQIAATRLESLETVSKERDALASQLDALKTAQIELVQRAAKAVATLQAAVPETGLFEELLGVLTDAQTPLKERKLAEIAAKKKALLAEVAALDQQAVDVTAGHVFAAAPP